MRNKAQCSICTLNKSIYVPSEFNGSKIVILAEAPGETETQLGKPLVGDAGRALMDIIGNLNKSRLDFNYINICSCRPTKIIEDRVYNRQPTVEEAKACLPRLEAEIDSIAPNIIVTMGLVPYYVLNNITKGEMSKIVGKEFVWRGYDCIATYHPAAILYGGGKNAEQGNKIYSKIYDALFKALNHKVKPKQLVLF